MNLQELSYKFVEHPSYFKKGAAFLANLWDVTEDEIKKAKELARKQLSAMLVETPEEEIVKESTEKIIEVTSKTPLSPEDIDKLAKVDNINTYVSNYWVSNKTRGEHSYSIQIKKTSNKKSFYTLNELEEKLSEMAVDVKPSTFVPNKNDSELVGIVCISDIHAGAKNSELNIHGITYSEKDLQDRLDLIIQKLINKGVKYETLVISNLGDSLDGWDGYTTRKGHSLHSASNKDQFDIYFRCMTKFYSSLFESNIANRYLVWNCLDDNHGGLQFSYICNQSVQNILELKYPQTLVQFKQQFKFIDTLKIKKHCFAFTHGKDGAIMKYPMKKHLDDRIENWAYQYFMTSGYQHTYNTIIKGDLHCFANERGKFGNYINTPSIYGTSDYISLNYGTTRPGSLLLEFNPNYEEITTTPFWF